MHLNFKAGGSVVLTDELRTFVEGKMKKIQKIASSKELLMADIELSTTTKGQKTGVYRAEINLQYTGGFVRAEATESSLHHAIEIAVEELRGELRKTLGKRRDLVRHGGALVKSIFRRFGGS